jgi:hypothetical protein
VYERMILGISAVPSGQMKCGERGRNWPCQYTLMADRTCSSGMMGRLGSLPAVRRMWKAFWALFW